MVASRPLQVLLGGSWHDFTGFGQRLNEWLVPEGWAPNVSFDPSCLSNWGRDRIGVALIDICYDAHTDLRLEHAQVHALRSWVRSGGGLVALHATAVVLNPDNPLVELVGGRFVSHPPKRPFSVRPTPQVHPITDGIRPFDIEDERYLLEWQPDVNVHLITSIDGRDSALAWSRTEGEGKVVYLSLGHDESAWRVPEFQRLLVQALNWAANS